MSPGKRPGGATGPSYYQSRLIHATRTNTDFVCHIFHIVQTDPTAGWVFIVDQLNIHCSEELVHYVALALKESNSRASGRKTAAESSNA